MAELNTESIINEEPKRSNKKIIIISIIIALILLFFISRALIQNSIIKNGSKQIDTFAFGLIGKSLILGQPAPNITNLDQAYAKLTNDESFIQNKIEELRKEGKILTYIQNKTYICDNGTIISPEEYTNGKRCNSSDLEFKTEGSKEYIGANISGRSAIMELTGYSSYLNLKTYAYYVLEIHSIEKKNIASIFAQTYDEIIYIPQIAIILNTLIRSLDKNLINNSDDAKLILIKLESINNKLDLPSEDQINNLDLKDDCINTYEQLNGVENIKGSLIERILFIQVSKTQLCEKLADYQKINAIRILKSTKISNDPLGQIINKAYLNGLVTCPSESFGGSEHSCRDNYFKEFESKFNV